MDIPMSQLSEGHEDVENSSISSEDECWDRATFSLQRTATSIRRNSVETLEARQEVGATQLPHELILEIFKFLPTTRDLYSTLLTCQTWCACSVEMLWYKPVLYSATSLVKLLATLRKDDHTFEYPNFIRRLNLSYLADQVSDALILKMQSCRRLERLTLVNCKRVTDRGLCDILSRNNGLIALDVSNLELITDLPVLVAASRNKELQGLNLAGCISITDDAIISIASSCKNLRRV